MYTKVGPVQVQNRILRSSEAEMYRATRSGSQSSDFHKNQLLVTRPIGKSLNQAKSVGNQVNKMSKANTWTRQSHETGNHMD